MLASLWLVAKWLLLIAGLLLPGAALMRALRLPVTIATSFGGSVVGLYVTVLALQFSGARIGLGSVAIGLLLIVFASWLARHKADEPRVVAPLNTSPIRTADARWFVFSFTLFACAVLWRAWHEPLAGPDVEFRWAFLAEQMLRHGSLDFYPPRSAADFTLYFWAESIPPGVAVINAWAFACAGGSHFAWTVPAVVLQFWSLYEFVWRIAEKLAGPRGARLAVLAVAAGPLLTWSLLLGQETGVTTLSLLGMLWAYVHWREASAARWAVAIGVFALLGSSAREYGLVFPALATLGLLGAGADRRTWRAFGSVALFCLAWPLRCWVLTGNPAYSLTIGHLFPINERFVAWIRHDAASFGAPLHTLDGWREVGRQLVSYAPTALLGGMMLLGAIFKSRENLARHAAVAAATILLLWILSVPYTNGGLFYSMRVASPAIAVGALAAGLAAARWGAAHPRSALPLAAGFSVLMLATLPATLALPRNPWRTPVREWPAFAPPLSPPLGLADDVVALLQRMPDHGIVIADAPGFQRRFQPVGVTVIPLWSPQADWLFNLNATPAAAARRWRESGVRTLVVTKWQRNLDFLNEHARWNRPPFHIQMIGETAQAAVFSIRATP